VVLIIFCL